MEGTEVLGASRIARLKEALNNDPEFLLTARMWNASVRLNMEKDALLVKIHDGKVIDIEAGHYDFDLLTPGDVFITAPYEDWQKFLAPVPKPFYVDLWGATIHHGFRITGDMETFYAYYPALRRFFDVMREVTLD